MQKRNTHERDEINRSKVDQKERELPYHAEKSTATHATGNDDKVMLPSKKKKKRSDSKARMDSR